MKTEKVSDILGDTARAHPDSPAIIDERGQLTYAGLRAAVHDLASRIRLAGIKPGMHIGIHLPNSRDFIIALFASSMTSAVVIPLGYNLDQGELLRLADELAIDGIIFDTKSCLRDRYAGNSRTLGANMTLCVLPGQRNRKSEIFPDAAFIRPSSGTTGSSKGVVISHSNVFRRIENAVMSLSLNSADRILWVLPMAYHFLVSVLTYVKAGAAIIISAEHHAAGLIELARRHNATILYATPVHFTMLAEEDGEDRLPSLKWAICTAGGISSTLSKRFEERQGNVLRQVYGIFEAGLPIGNLQRPPSNPETLGKVLPGYEAAIIDESGSRLPAGAIGELIIKGQGLFDGYFQAGQNSRQIMSEGWFHTGDLAAIDAEGNYRIVGRAKSMMILAGNKIFSEEVERVLNDHPQVALSKVYAVNHELLGEIIHADIIAKVGATIKAAELRNFCQKQLEGYKVPLTFNLVDHIDLTASGKVMRYTPLRDRRSAA